MDLDSLAPGQNSLGPCEVGAHFLFNVFLKVIGAPLEAVGRRIGGLLVFVGAVEMTTVSAAAQWCRAHQAKLHLKYKYVRRIWRRTNGNFGAFMRQLLHGIEAAQGAGSSSNAAGRGSKSGSKRGGKSAAARGCGRPSSSSSSSTARLQESESWTSSTAASYASNSSSSSSSAEDDDEPLAELLTLSPATSARISASSNTKQSKPHAVAQGKHASGRTAAAKAKQPAASAAKASSEDASKRLGNKAVAAIKESSGFSNKSNA
jgi:hypothetical protein